MSSRNRHPANRRSSRARRPDLTVPPGPDQACDCPDCTAGGLHPEQLLTNLVNDASALTEVDDPLEAELAGALCLAEDLDQPLTAGPFTRPRQDGVHIRTKKLGAPEFRWHVEQALQARAVHDEQDGSDRSPSGLDLIDNDGPGYAPLAVLTRSRLETLPPARRPRGATASPHTVDRTTMDALQQFAALIGNSGGPAAFGLDLPTQRRALPAKLPAKRKRTNEPAPIYQIKISLRGAKPPIWRRLLVPGDITLNHLHQTILAAFGWHGDHLHVFDTAYGQFGHADRDLEHLSDTAVTLEQVAPASKDKIRYTYDFGDDWEHDILVEKTTPADPAVDLPVCTGGRRAAPPDDCGGIWGYQYLIDVLTDPNHPEHQDRLEWLGLDNASQFTPEKFDLDQINQRL